MLVIKMQVGIDCEDLTCINFTDITKAYNSGSNPTGYGGPNIPEIADIQAVKFTLTKDGEDFVFIGSGYLPSAAGNSIICLSANNFVNDLLVPIEFVKGQSYTLKYVLDLGASVEIEATPQEFVFPCCGAAVDTSIGTKFKITEKLGCSSLDFKDTTGLYNSLNNPAGYGGPNPTYDDITSTLIKITRADGTVINITDFIPTLASQIRNIAAAELGYDEGAIIPQVVSIEYSVFAQGTCIIGYKLMKMLLHCFLRNCIVSKGKALLVSACNNPCDPSERKMVISLIVRYEMLLLASYDSIECIDNAVDMLYDECKKYCGTC